MSNIEQRIQSILDQLEQTNEDLLALSDDIWLSIDHNDNEALRDGIQFKEEYNEKLAEFNRLSENISFLVEEYTGLSTEEEETAEVNTEENERIIKALDKGKKHYLDEDFKYKRPYGFSIRGKAFRNVRTWQKLYQLSLNYLSDHFKNFDLLINHPDFTSNRGNKDFSSSKGNLRQALKITGNVYAESNLSANQIKDRVIKLLDYFEISNKEFLVYLREDRDWGNQT